VLSRGKASIHHPLRFSGGIIKTNICGTAYASNDSILTLINVKDLNDIKPVWVLVAVTLPVMLAGLCCALIFHNASMFYVSLLGAGLMVVAIPFVIAFRALLSVILLFLFKFIDPLRHLLSRRK
jgi:hypothetical protein